MMKFVVRDDDLNYFSRPQDIERWYRPVFDEGISVLFSVIPFVTPGSKYLYHGGTPEMKPYPISNNPSLCEYIKNNPFVEVAQHGYNHEPGGTGFEYRRGSDMVQKTREGRDELERAIGAAVKIFVPPHDAIDAKGIAAVEAAGMDIIRGTGSKNVMPRFAYIGAWTRMAIHRLRFPNKRTMPAYPYVVDFGKHKEAYAVRLNNDNIDFLLAALRYAARKRGNFIVTNHIFTNNDLRMENLLLLIREARKLGFSFVRASELFSDENN